MISFVRYAALLAQPHLKATIVASVIGRLPIGIAGLAILLLARSASGSFGRAGATTAFYVAGLAIVAPLLGRLIDRRGPRAVLLVCAGLYPAALLALAAAILGSVPAWILMPTAAVAGASYPPITVCMRTFLKRRLGDDTLLATAYSLESVLIETIFIVGPLLVAGFVAAASPVWAVAFAAACGALGTILFLRSPPLSNWRIEPLRAGRLLGPLSEPGFLHLLGVILCYSTAFGLVEIGVTAFAAEAGAPALAGVMLGLMSIGSVAGGLIYGSRGWHLPLGHQFALTLAVMGTGIAPLAIVANPWLFAVFAVLAGVVMAPALTIQSMLVARTARGEHSTEAFTWSATGLLAGFGLGLAVGGQLLEAASATAALAAATSTALTAGLLAHLQFRRFT
jgi:MFS family permease